MQKTLTVTPFKKTLPAWLAALSMSLFIAVAFLAFGLNAFFNRNISITKPANQPDSQASADQVTIQELQATLSQYQAREAQYQNELKQAADQNNQANQQNQQYQQLVQALVNAGVIQITQDGRVFISRGSGFPSGFNDDNR